ncbi:hypothetical protein ACFQV2_20030 [Actinokineospora soli]|uniref:Uncharacterized protein n=1 Tax=Actinokineospora soli TaxID=1048753 RepID=A0ABW2TP07_9PSEU
MTLPLRSTTLSRFHRHAWSQCDAAKVDLWQGSPASSPNTGTVHVDFASGSLPKWYSVPSTAVMTHRSPLSSPLPAPSNRSIREPSSLRGRQTPVASSRMSMPPRPP